ncbi:Integrase core domain [Popillia japonica]|uniref:Integrase core domain n=1 Tax=Popillia japonica TaxID=7064 RepID=A0AAW1LV16_POPJA
MSYINPLDRGYKYILVVIDAFSKYLWTQPLKTKSAVEVKDAMDKILKEGRKPKNLQTDAGKEFYNQSFKSLIKIYNINRYSTYSLTKASIAERAVRTLKEQLYKEFSLHGNYNWRSILDDITKRYNHTIHRTIGMKPVDVTLVKESALLSSAYNRPKIAGKRKFAVNDVVRISKHKSLFDKGYTPNWLKATLPTGQRSCLKL